MQKYILFNIIFVLTSFQIFAGPVSAEESRYPQEFKSWKATIHPGARLGNGRSMGYADYLLPVAQNKDSLWSVNTKTVFSSYGDSEENLGVIYRRLLADDSVILGANFYYDTRFTPSNRYVHQIGWGLELLGPTLEARTNVYHALSDEELIGSSKTYAFSGTKVIQNIQSLFEEPMSGFDYEAGILLPYVSSFMESRIFVGGYYYYSNLIKDIPGFRGRIEVKPSPLFTLQLEVKDDRTTDVEYYAGGYFTLPFDLGSLFQAKNPFEGADKAFRLGQPTRPLRERMTDPVTRDIDIVTQESFSIQTDTVVPVILHVNNANDADPKESGTFEHPYNTLAEATADPRFASNSWLYVAYGDGSAIGYTGVLTLGAGRVLWGEGYQAFPGLGGGNHPLISGGGVVTAIDMAGINTTVQGVQVLGFFENGILSTADGAMIRNNVIRDVDDAVSGNDVVAIRVNSSGGVKNNSILNNTIINISSSSGGSAYGIGVLPDAGTMNTLIAGNRVQSAGQYGIILLAQTGSTMTAILNRNVVQGCAFAALVATDGASTLTADLGRGPLGAIGLNSFFGNSSATFLASSVSATAQNNFFGGGAASVTDLGGGTIDTTNFLTTNPN